MLKDVTGRNTFGTCFGETGLKIRPDVFRHDNSEQKKHFLLCKMSPASHFFLFEKGEKNNNEICSQLLWRNTLGRLSVPLLVPDAFSRTQTVADIRFAISCDRMRSHAIACNRMKSQTLCRQLSEFLKMHWEREAGQKVCLKCFFTTTVNRFHIIFFAFSKRKK